MIAAAPAELLRPLPGWPAHPLTGHRVEPARSRTEADVVPACPTVAAAFLRWGQQAARAGYAAVAHALFVSAIEADPRNADAWLWRAATAASPAEGVACLERVLRIDPANPRALVGLAELRAGAASATLASGPISAISNPARPWLRSEMVGLPLGLMVAAALVLVHRSEPIATAPALHEPIAVSAPSAQVEAVAPSARVDVVAQPETAAGTAASGVPVAATVATAAGALTASAPVPAWRLDRRAWRSPFEDSQTRPAPLREPAPPPSPDRPWVATHRETGLWSGSGEAARLFRVVEPGTHFQVARPQEGTMLYVWDPKAKDYAYVEAITVGPAGDPNRKPPPAAPPAPPAPARAAAAAPAQSSTLASAVVPSAAPAGGRVIWSGTARISMYTCVELGGCNATASGVWPYEGVVAVDPRQIPLGSTVYIEGLGTFLAADTGSAIYGNRIDVYSSSYDRAIQWGVRYLPATAYRSR